MALGNNDIAIKKMRVCMGNQKTVCATAPATKLTGADYTDNSFSLFDAQGVEHVVWYNVDGAGTDPSTPPQVGIEVAVASTDSVEQVTQAAADAIDALAGLCAFTSRTDKRVLIYKVLEYATAADPVEGATPTDFEFETIKEGYFEDLGATEGDIDISYNPTFLDVTCHQTGTQLVSQQLTGLQPEVSITFKECRQGVFDRLITNALGGECTEGTSRITGFGTAKNGVNTLSLASRLILKPVENAEGDFTGSYAFLAALPLVDSTLFSGENISTVTATFSAYVDPTAKCEETNIVAVGDHFLI